MSEDVSPLPWSVQGGGDYPSIASGDQNQGYLANVASDKDAEHIVKCVNAYPALEAENKRLRDLLRECRVHAETRKNHAQHALYCTNGGPESLPYKARLKAITDLLARIHKALGVSDA